jgi:hypothetical protein
VKRVTAHVLARPIDSQSNNMGKELRTLPKRFLRYARYLSIEAIFKYGFCLIQLDRTVASAIIAIFSRTHLSQ